MKRGFMLLAAALSISSAAQAQNGERPAAPYRPVAVTMAIPMPPDGLDAFRVRLAAIAAGRDTEALVPLLVRQGLFWDDDHSGAFDRKKSSFDNLAAAIALDQEEGNLGWSNLARFAALPAAPHGTRRNVMCSPPEPDVDAAALDRLLQQTVSEATDWAAPLKAGLTVRLQPRDDGDPIETLGMNLVLIDGAEEPKATDFRAWSIVMTPSGKRGYVLANDLVYLGGDRLCYVRDSSGAWRIAGYVGGAH